MLRFFNQYIANSPIANFCIRYNRGQYSPFRGVKWEIKESSVVEDFPFVYTAYTGIGSGIFAFASNENRNFYQEKDWNDDYELHKEEPIKIILMDYDKEAVISGPPFYELLDFRRHTHEIRLAYANIVAVYTEEEFETASVTGELCERMESFMRVKQQLYNRFLYRERPWFWTPPPVFRVDGVNTQDMRHYLMDAARTLPAFMSKVHGIYHWKWVANMAMEMFLNSQYQIDLLVCMWFAVLHDSHRQSDGDDEGHGQRASEYIDHIRDVYLAGLTDEQVLKLKKACRTHTSATEEDDITVAVCIDSDRLHLWRVGIDPDPKRLLTQYGKEVAQKPYKDWPLDNHEVRIY